MKNTQITRLGILVPKEIRLEVYKEALEILENNKKKSGLSPDDGICLLLPCVLWDLNNWGDFTPDGKTWVFFDTKKSFPELTQNIVSDIMDKDTKKERILTRVSYLKQFIEELS